MALFSFIRMSLGAAGYLRMRLTGIALLAFCDTLTKSQRVLLIGFWWSPWLILMSNGFHYDDYQKKNKMDEITLWPEESSPELVYWRNLIIMGRYLPNTLRGYTKIQEGVWSSVRTKHLYHMCFDQYRKPEWRSIAWYRDLSANTHTHTLLFY